MGFEKLRNTGLDDKPVDKLCCGDFIGKMRVFFSVLVFSIVSGSFCGGTLIAKNGVSLDDKKAFKAWVLGNRRFYDRNVELMIISDNSKRKKAKMYNYISIIETLQFLNKPVSREEFLKNSFTELQVLAFQSLLNLVFNAGVKVTGVYDSQTHNAFESALGWGIDVPSLDSDDFNYDLSYFLMSFNRLLRISKARFEGSEVASLYRRGGDDDSEDTEIMYDLRFSNLDFSVFVENKIPFPIMFEYNERFSSLEVVDLYIAGVDFSLADIYDVRFHGTSIAEMFSLGIGPFVANDYGPQFSGKDVMSFWQNSVCSSVTSLYNSSFNAADILLFVKNRVSPENANRYSNDLTVEEIVDVYGE